MNKKSSGCRSRKQRLMAVGTRKKATELGIAVTKLLASGAPQDYATAFGTAWSLLGSLRNGQAALYLKHLLFREYIHKAVPLQAWRCPEGSRKLRFPNFVTTAQDGG